MKSPYSFLLLFSISILLAGIGCKGDSPSNQASVLPRGQGEHLDRFEQEIQAFEAADATNMPPQNAVLFVGSSSIRMWNSLAEDFAPLPVINRGFGGSTIPEVSYYAKRVIYKYQPSVVVFYCGDNDLASSDPPALAFQNFKKFIGETEKNLKGTPIVFISAKPSPSRWNLWRNYQQFNAMVEQFANNRPNLRYVDISSTLLDANGQPDPAFFAEDKLHLNSQGYAKWTAVLKPVVMELYEKELAQ
jgi:lysophospholipase L1-like esterase